MKKEQGKKEMSGIDYIKKGMAMLEANNMPASEEDEDGAEAIQGAMDMGMESPNAPNGEDDAENKDQGGFDKAKKRKAFVAMMSKSKGM